MLAAGTQTMQQSIGNGIQLLLQADGYHSRYTAMADSEQAVAIEELMRVESPVKCLLRVVKGELQYKQHTFRFGEQVLFIYAAANRDSRVFENPMSLDLTRMDNIHIAFSAGAHHCLGLHLGRFEVRLALKILFERLPNIKLCNAEPQWEHSFFSRELLNLPVQLA